MLIFILFIWSLRVEIKNLEELARGSGEDDSVLHGRSQLNCSDLVDSNILANHLCAWIVVIAIQGSTTLRRNKIIGGIDTNIWLFEVGITLDEDTHASTLTSHYETAPVV